MSLAQMIVMDTYPTAWAQTNLWLGAWQLLGRGGGVGHDQQGGQRGAVLRAVRRVQAAERGRHLLQWRAPISQRCMCVERQWCHAAAGWGGWLLCHILQHALDAWQSILEACEQLMRQLLLVAGTAVSEVALIWICDTAVWVWYGHMNPLTQP